MTTADAPLAEAGPGLAPAEAPEQRQVLRTLVLAQVFSGAGLAAGVTVGSLLARDMFGSDGLAGVPSALFTIGSAATAVIVGRISDAHGRRPGLALGYAAGAAGAVLVVVAAALDSVPLLLPALLIYGAGTATNLQARYAGADLASSTRRGRAVSTVLVATALGAIIGPNVVDEMGSLAESLDLPRLAGPFLLAAAAYGLAGLVLLARLRPDPLLLARRRRASAAAATPSLAGDDAGRRDDAHGIDGGDDARRRAVLVGAFTMVIAQLVMVAIMTMTPVHMEHHGHALGATGAVISAHIAGMYLPSPLSGRLVDRVGPRLVAFAAAVTLAVAGVLAAAVPPASAVGLGVALAVLGIGWNLGLVSGTALLADAVPLAVRARTQGGVDLCIALAGAGAGLGSGIVVAGTSYGTLALLGGGAALVLVPVVAGATGGSGEADAVAAAEGAERPAS